MHTNGRRKRSNSDEVHHVSLNHHAEGLESEVVPEKKRGKVFEEFIHKLIFPNLPEQYPFRKKLQISKNTTRVGLAYDLSQDFCSMLMCVVFIASTYYNSYAAVHTIYYLDITISIYVLVDILFNLYLVGTRFLLDIRCIVDALAIFPTIFRLIYTTLLGQTLTFYISQMISTLRLIRIMRIFKTLRFYHSMRKAVLKLLITMSCFIFVCSGLFQFFENDMPQNHYQCQYINADTGYHPSCSEVMPAVDMGDCDCEEYHCTPLYDVIDLRNRPSQIRCQILDFNSALYFVVITVTLVGYGAIDLSFYSKVAVVALIILAIIVIPPQLNEVEKFMTAKTTYRDPYLPAAGDYHVVVCGHVNDKKKLSAFLKEFLHPDRMFSSSPQFHVVIMANSEPNDGVLELLQSQFLEGRITYCIGSALVQKDLQRVRIDSAYGMFFLCNTELDASKENIEDTATVMRALSVSNFNPSTECFVQVLKADDRKILKDSDVDVILCLDEYKITLQAKNAICPGFSTLIENLFHSFGGISSAVESELDPWYHEYLHGARMELYYVPLDLAFMKFINYNFSVLTEVVYTEWNLILMGVCTRTQDELAFNPISKKTLKSDRFENMHAFYEHFNTAVIIADDNLQAEEVGKGLTDASRYSIILRKMKVAEVNFPVRPKAGSKKSQVPEKRAQSQRSSFLLQGVTNARNSLSKQKSRLVELVVSSRPALSPEMPSTVTKEVQKLYSEHYDSDDSMEENDYIGYAKTRSEEIQAAEEAQSQTGYSDDGGGKGGLGRTSMVYTRQRNGLDVLKAKAALEGHIRGNIATKKSVLQSSALKAFSSKALARGRKLSVIISGKGVQPARVAPITSSTSTDEATSCPKVNTSASSSNLSPSEIINSVPSIDSAMSTSLDKFDEEDEDEGDEEGEEGDGSDEKHDRLSWLQGRPSGSKLSVVSVSSTIQKRLGTFKISEGDHEESGEDESDGTLSEEGDQEGGRVERKEEEIASEIDREHSSGDTSQPSAMLTPGKATKVKHQTWGTLRESVVRNSPSQMLRDAAADRTPVSEDDDEADPHRSLKHLDEVADVLRMGKKFTVVHISDVLKAEVDRKTSADSGDNSAENGGRSCSNSENIDEETEGRVVDESPVKTAARAPRRSVLRHNVAPDANSSTAAAAAAAVTVAANIASPSSTGSGQTTAVRSSGGGDGDDSKERDTDDEGGENSAMKHSTAKEEVVVPPPQVIISPSQMLRKGCDGRGGDDDNSKESDEDEDEDEDEEEEEEDNKGKNEKNGERNNSSEQEVAAPPSYALVSPSQMLKKGGGGRGGSGSSGDNSKESDEEEEEEEEEDDDDDGKEEEVKEETCVEGSLKQKEVVVPPPVVVMTTSPLAASARQNVLQLSPSQMLKKPSGEEAGGDDSTKESDDDEEDEEDVLEVIKPPQVKESVQQSKPQPQPKLRQPPQQLQVAATPVHSSSAAVFKAAGRAPRRTIMRKNVTTDNKITTSANSASVQEAAKPRAYDVLTSFDAMPIRQKLPPLSTGRDAAKKKAGGAAVIAPEKPGVAVKGPPAALFSPRGSCTADTKKRKIRIKALLSHKFNRSNRVAVVCEPGMMSPTINAVMSQIKTMQSSEAPKGNPVVEPPKRIDRSFLKKGILRASILQKRGNDNEGKEHSSTSSLTATATATATPIITAKVLDETAIQMPKSLYGGFSAVVKKAVLNQHPESRGGIYGRPSDVISDAGFLSNHIVIFGNVAISHIFIAELRRPTVRGEAYHSILLIDVEKPPKWDSIVLQYTDVYFLQGSLLRSKGFSKSNIEKAFAVILLNIRTELSLNENIDSHTLFSYLKLEQYVPRNVFFSVELSNPANMSVLNATLMRRVRNHGTFESRMCVKSTPLPSNLPGVQAIVAPVPIRPRASVVNAPGQPQHSHRLTSPSSSLSPPPGVASHHLTPTVATVVRAVSISQMALAAGLSSSDDEEDEDVSNENSDDAEKTAQDELRKQNIANFRAQMRLKKQESESIQTGGFSSNRKTNRNTNRQSVSSPDTIPLAARGSVSRVHARGSVVLNRNTFSNFRPPDHFLVNDEDKDNSGTGGGVMSGSGEDTGEENQKPKEEMRKEIVNNDDDFWNATDTHHMLPVFAAARAYVPSTFESLLVQSFFGVLTPMMCEIFVCGQAGQSIVQIDVPEAMHGRTFLEMFRVFSYHQVLCIGLYRAPTEDTMSTLPYVYLTPPQSAKLFYEDRVFLYGKQSRIDRAVETCKNVKWKAATEK